jgi:hypothetical protein
MSLSITVEELKDHMYYLASDELKGRLPGTPGYDKAVEYAITQFRQSNLVPTCKAGNSLVYLQTVPFEKYKWNDENIAYLKKKNVNKQYKITEHYMQRSNAPLDLKELEGEVVYVAAGVCEPDYGIDNYKNVDVKGKWVICYRSLPDTFKTILPSERYNEYINEGTKILERNAVEAGAIGIIYIPTLFYLNNWTSLADHFSKVCFIKEMGNLFYDSKLTSIVADSTFLEDIFEGSGYNPLSNKQILTSFTLNDTEVKLTISYTYSEFISHNVIGMVEGSDPELKEEIITVGAHLDHVGIEAGEIINGADDDGSGSVAILEIAEAVAMSKPNRSVMFLLYTAEEMGLLGSWYFTEHPTVPIERIKANINLDMIGRSDGDVQQGIAPITTGPMDINLKNAIVKVQKEFPDNKLDWEYANTTSYRTSSDHYPYALINIPHVFFFNGSHEDYHHPGDDAEKIDYEFLKSNSRFVYQLLMELANGKR